MKQILTLDLVRSWLAPRARDANKGSFGHVLIVGSDYGMPGAVYLAASGAARVGAGLVTVVTRPEQVMMTVIHRPEILCFGIDASLDGIDALIDKATVIVLGPGLGRSAWSERLFEKILQSSLPLIIDADGLNWLSQMKPPLPRSNWILTPHPGEAARLLGISVEDIQADRSRAAQLIQRDYGGVIVLKGADSLIATNKAPLYHCMAGNPGMASAGMGDLLGGMIAGFVAQGLTLDKAACAGVLFHATAGDRLVSRFGERGLLASDLLLELPLLINNKLK